MGVWWCIRREQKKGGQHGHVVLCRRVDLIFTIPAELPFCLLGWTGSRQYMRFLRSHADQRGMKLNSHRWVSLYLVRLFGSS